MPHLPVPKDVEPVKRRAASSDPQPARERSLLTRGASYAQEALSAHIAQFGGGVYGLLATVAFVYHQIRAVSQSDWVTWAKWEATAGQLVSIRAAPEILADLVWGLLFNQGTGWVDGFIFALMWPVHLLKLLGPLGLIAAIVAAGACVVLMRRFDVGFSGSERNTEREAL